MSRFHWDEKPARRFGVTEPELHGETAVHVGPLYETPLLTCAWPMGKIGPVVLQFHEPAHEGPAGTQGAGLNSQVV